MKSTLFASESLANTSISKPPTTLDTSMDRSFRGLTWVFAWNEYLFAATLTSVHARTITTGLAEFVTVTGTNWGQLAATAMITLIPAVVFLGLVQRHIVAGLTFGAVKE